MWKIVAPFTIILGLSIGYPQKDPTNRIIGGYNASIADYPYALQVEYHSEVHELICGAILVAPTWALTACHCLWERDMDYTIRAGTSDRGTGGSTYNVTETFCHPNFRWSDDSYDAALLRLNETVSAPDTQVIEMAEQDSPIPEGETMMVVGWGYEDNNGNFPDVLQALEFPILDNATCAPLLANLANYTESMFCGGYMEGGKGFCWADNGGPAVHHGVLIGISSWVNYCATANTPGAFTKISLVRSWIDSIISS